MAKTEKKVSSKKLPGLFKKAYSEKKFNDSIISKIYVEADKKLVTGLFEKSKDKKGNPVLSVPADKEFTSTEIKKLKILAKEIKANKGTVKAGSFFAVAVVIAALALTVTVFKNPVAKLVITNGMQQVFGAKCDVGSVNIEFINSRITVNNLEQASSSDPMKNIFQFERFDLKFNLSQLLRGRLDTENIEITGIDVNTDRKTSGKLLVKPKPVRAKEEKNDSTGFYESLKVKAGTDTDAAKDAFTQLFAAYDPNAISSNIKENLQSQKVAKEVEEELKVITENWKNKPAELQKSVDDAKASAEKITKLNVSKITAAEVPALLKQIDSVGEDVKKTKTSVSSVTDSYNADQKRVKELQKKLNDAIASDKALLNNQLGVLDVSKSKELISDTINKAGYALLGKYYPYLKKLIAYAGSMKAGDSDEGKKALKESKKNAKTEHKRYEGRFVYWKQDRVPRILIEKLHGTGRGIEINATNISSDMNKRGEPWVISGNLERDSKVHYGNLVVDARTDSKNPLISGKYTGKNFPLNFDMAKNIKAEGVPKIEGKSDITANLTADSDFSFTGSGAIKISDATVTAEPLKAETAARIYGEALSSIHSLSADVKVGFTEKSGVDLNIDTDFDKVLSSAISAVASKEMAGAKDQAAEKMNEYLGSNDVMTKYLTQFNEAGGKLNSAKSTLEEFNTTLNQKKAELEKKTTAAAANAVSNKAAGAAGSLIKGLKK